LDDDVYFWRKWAEAGFSCFIAPHVVVGHLQLMVTWPGRDGMAPVHQYASHYRDGGLPKGVWE
jgi:hypothetical protein